MGRVSEFLNHEEWDAPFFKRLAHNDTGDATGHQAGIYIPTALRRFFPTLDEALITPTNPTIDRALRAELYLGLSYAGEAVVRYQYQTWRRTRTPESRLTGNLGAIHAQARGGDVLILQRASDSLDHFRLLLIRGHTADASEVRALAGDRRWGILFEDEQPVTRVELAQAKQDIDVMLDQPFALTAAIIRVETRQSRIARSSVFRQVVKREYDYSCSVSGSQIATPSLLHEVQAAHIVPVSEGGTDDVRNGLALTQTLHWAFDRGLFGIRPDRTVYIPHRVRAIEANEALLQFQGQAIAEAASRRLRVHADALAWHFAARVMQWE